MAAAWHDHYTRNWWCWNKVKTKKCAKYQDQWLCKMTLNVFKKLTRTQAEGKGRDVLLRICWTFTMQSAWINRGPLDQVLMLQWKPRIVTAGKQNEVWSTLAGLPQKGFLMLTHPKRPKQPMTPGYISDGSFETYMFEKDEYPSLLIVVIGSDY